MQMIETDKIMPLMRLLLLFEPNADERLALVKPVIDMHSVEAVPVIHSQWTLNNDGSGTCKHCGFTQKNVWDMDSWQNFCGHCGADMRSENDEC